MRALFAATTDWLDDSKIDDDDYDDDGEDEDDDDDSYQRIFPIS